MQAYPGRKGIAEGVKKNGGRECAGFFTQPTKGKSGEKDRKMPPLKIDQAVRQSKEEDVNKKRPAHRNTQKIKSIVKHGP